MEVPEPIDERALTIYVDGSMRSSPRRDGIGILFVWVKDDGHSTPSSLERIESPIPPSSAFSCARSISVWVVVTFMRAPPRLPLRRGPPSSKGVIGSERQAGDGNGFVLTGGGVLNR